MSVIARTVVINPVEAVSLSMRLRSGLVNKIDVTYVRQNGAPYNTDIAGQLYLQRRTDGRQQMYLLPATDIVNGQARAVIPAGDITDPNGYNIQIIGTVDNEPRLIARGFAGVMITPALSMIPADVIDTIDLIFAANLPATVDVSIWQDAGKYTEYNLPGTTVIAGVYSEMGGSLIMPFTVNVLDNNTARLSLTGAQVGLLPTHCWWVLSVSTVSGTTTLAQGNVNVVVP